MNIILLSGGSGQRLWPLSNEIRSKQFIKIFHTEDGGLESMVQRVYRQIREADPEAKITIATSKAQISSIHNQLGENVGISMEPCRRDTFPAIALAVAYLQDVQGVTGEEPVIVCPVDPYVEKDYFEALQRLEERAAQSAAHLVLMGMNRRIPAKNMAISFRKQRKISARWKCLRRNRTRSRQRNISDRERCGTAECLPSA